MNQAQRKFLIDKIESNVKKTIENLRRNKSEQPPTLENYFYGLALTGKLEVKSSESIAKYMAERAMTHTAKSYGESWLGTSHGDIINHAKVKIPIRQLFVIPKEYDDLWEDYRKQEQEREDKIKQLEIECETLVTRIQLASDKTLEKMISEIDDMGDISLMDTKLKTMISNGANKLIE